MRDQSTFGLQFHPQYVTWEEIRESALFAERCGWDVLTTWDHFRPIVGDPTGPNFEGWQVLAALAAVTSRPMLGMLVSGNTYRHPALLANMASTLDNISAGRAVLGVGAAWNEDEHRMYGIEFGTAAQRAAKLDESVRIMRALVDGVATTFHGKYYDITNAMIGTRPIQRRLPILIGGSGERVTLRVAARDGDWWHGWGPASLVERNVATLKRHCDAVGRDYNEIRVMAGGQILVRDSEREIEQRLQDVALRSRTSTTKRPSAIGSPNDIAKQLLEYHVVGVRGFLFGMAPPYDRETIERVISEVRPRFFELSGQA